MYGRDGSHCYVFLFYLAAIVNASKSADYREFLNIQRTKPHYIISAPEVFSAGDTNSVNIALTGRTGNTLVHVVLEKWHGGEIIASTAKFVSVAQLGIPLILNLKIPDDISDKYALLIVRLLGNNFKKEVRLVRTKKRPLKIFLKTNKGIYQYGEKIQFWVVVLDRDVHSFKGKIDSIMLKDSYGNIADYKRDIILHRGLAASNISTENIVSDGKVELTALVQNQESSVLLFVGDYREYQRKEKDVERKRRMYNYWFAERSKKEYFTSISAELQEFKSKLTTPLKETFYSESKSFIEILMPSADVKPDSVAKFIVVYNNPTNGVNSFFYQVICGDKTLVLERFQDLYSSLPCFLRMYQHPYLYESGPSKMALCMKKRAWFTITFKVTSSMSPSCRFLVYRMHKKGELIAADKEFRVPMKLRRKLEITPKTHSVFTNENLVIGIKGSGNSSILLAGLRHDEVPSEAQILCEAALLHYTENRSTVDEVVKISTYCNGKNFFTAGQCFRNSGLKIITDLKADPDVPCFRGSRVLRSSRSLKTKRQAPQHIAGSNNQPWIWKEIQLRNDQHVWESRFKAPEMPGRYMIEAFSVNENGELDVAKTISVKVQQKMGINDTNLDKSEKNSQIKKNDRHSLVTIQILPNKEANFFVLDQCQPMKMKICVSSRNPTYESIIPGVVVIEITMIPGFRLADKDLRRLLKRWNRKLTSYFTFSNRTFLFIKQKSSNRQCFYIRLKQYGPFRNSKNSGKITFYRSTKTEMKMTTRYWITEKTCSYP